MNSIIHSTKFDSIDTVIRNHYNKDEKILDALRVYLGEAVIHWAGDEWTSMPASRHQWHPTTRNLVLLKFNQGGTKVICLIIYRTRLLKHKVFSNQIPESISRIIEIKSSISKKRMNK